MLCVINIDVRLEIQAPQEMVWGIISKIDDDPNYWREISSIRKISKSQNVVTRVITKRNGNEYHQKITLFPKEGMHIRWLKGPIFGISDILLFSKGNVTLLEVQINCKISGVVRIVPKNISEELQSEAEQAMRLVKKEAESKLQTCYN